MIDFRFADIGEGIHEGKILQWMVKEGDEVKDGDTLFTVETDKVNAEIPSPADGKINKIMAEEGDIINVGDIVVKIDDGNNNETPSKDLNVEPVNEGDEDPSGVVGELMVSSEVIESSSEAKIKEEDNKRKVLATPVARKLARDLNIDINTIKGTGPVGRVMKEDIYREEEKRNEKESKAEKMVSNSVKVDVPEIKVSGEVERVPLTMLRKTIAKNMVLSKTVIPHAVAIEEIDVSNLVKFRKENKEMAKENGAHLTYMPFIIKALVMTLKEFAEFNSSFDEEKEEIVLKKYYNIGIATDTPDGLMVPVIKDADKKGILELAKEISELSEKARNRTISLDKLQDGTMSITNFGAVGTMAGIPVIKHPEVAILGIGKITKKPVVEDDEIVIRDILTVTLSIDHRVIDGGDSGRFLNKLKEYLRDPMLLVLS
ncbi:dihydrolipoamide acetyltransferase family protein [Maledivibacter halophilus]|uniref:Dihydrolipoamide acetyltransferase component of pyruvate dehydrogenase complex n=1 Tax=Maledivibacter halophilus TaxID=36842 RepID=A0A1T5IHC0_9FIRM|nr:dihydrolipoamide acetyltransferase family protein [Maledivibacter halophilus]SKC38557.1 pyruvate dehydrogenase E2 component (dihydrolipoamide acetyltransferase) [Maledivibacter halophilus]